MQELNKTARPRGTDGARIIQVIETKSIRGCGTQDDLCRQVIQYWDFDGNLLAENDSVDSILKKSGNKQVNPRPSNRLQTQQAN